jgi:hypothetical protein
VVCGYVKVFGDAVVSGNGHINRKTST